MARGGPPAWVPFLASAPCSPARPPPDAASPGAGRGACARRCLESQGRRRTWAPAAPVPSWLVRGQSAQMKWMGSSGGPGGRHQRDSLRKAVGSLLSGLNSPCFVQDDSSGKCVGFFPFLKKKKEKLHICDNGTTIWCFPDLDSFFIKLEIESNNSLHSHGCSEPDSFIGKIQA